MIEMGDIWTENINETLVRIVPMNEISFKVCMILLYFNLLLTEYV